MRQTTWLQGFILKAASIEMPPAALPAGPSPGGAPVVAFTLPVSLQNHFAAAGGVVTIIIGMTFIIHAPFFRHGLAGEWQALP